MKFSAEIFVFPITTLITALIPLSGCRTFPMGIPGPRDREGKARPTLKVPESLAARFTPIHPGWALKLEPQETGADYQLYRFQFQTYSEVYLDFRRVGGIYYRSLQASRETPAPLVLVSPILGGAKDDYLACRVFGRWAARWGLSSFYLHQEEDILTGDRDAFELDRLLRDNILSNRKALDLLSRRPEVNPSRLGSLGISMGALKNVVLIAVEPRLKANVLCLAGGDLPRILLESRERMVLRYLQRRKQRDAMEPQEVAEEFRRQFTAEPLLFAQFVPPEKILLFLGSFDDKVPYPTGLELHRAMGRPDLHVLPLGHYTGILAAPLAARLGFSWMKERFRSAGSSSSGSRKA